MTDHNNLYDWVVAELVDNHHNLTAQTMEFCLNLIKSIRTTINRSELLLLIFSHMAPYTRRGLKYDYSELLGVLFSMGFRADPVINIVHYIGDSKEELYVNSSILHKQQDSNAGLYINYLMAVLEDKHKLDSYIDAALECLINNQ